MCDTTSEAGGCSPGTAATDQQRLQDRGESAILIDGKRLRSIWEKHISSYVEDPWTLWPFTIVYLLGFILRLLELHRPVRYDEAFTYLNYAMHPVHVAISNYSAPNNHLFHTLLVHFSTQLFGNNLTGLRLPAFVGGLLMMPAAFALTAALYNRGAAIGATALIACSPPFIEYSVNARGYTWQIVFLLLMAWFACRIGRQEGSVRHWAGLVLAAAGAIYTIPTGVLPCASILLWLVVIRWRHSGVKTMLPFIRQMIPAVAGMLVLVIVLYWPPVIMSGPHRIFRNHFVRPIGMAAFLPQLPELGQMTWVRWNDGVPLAVQACVFAGFVAGLIAHRKISRYIVPLGPAVILLCVAFAVARGVFGYPRVWLYLWAFFLITAGAGLAFVLSHRLLAAVIAVVLTAAVGSDAHRQNVFLWSTETGNVPGIADVVTWMDQHLDPRDRVAVSMLCEPPLRYLLHQNRRGWETQLKPGPAPRRIVAVITKQPEVDNGKASDPKLWNTQEVSPATIMFAGRDSQEYSEPRIAADLLGVTIWEAWNVSVSTAHER